MNWNSVIQLNSKKFVCGRCGNVVAANLGYYSGDGQYIYICPHCNCPTHFKAGSQYPDVAPGNDVNHLPKDVEALYREARNCVAASAYTGAVLLLRKLLMHIGVEQGGETGKSFVYYVEYLAGKGFVPPNGKAWVDHIRNKGNEATHEIKLMQKPDCEDLIAFTEMLMKFIYEFPSKVPQPKAP